MQNSILSAEAENSQGLSPLADHSSSWGLDADETPGSHIFYISLKLGTGRNFPRSPFVHGFNDFGVLIGTARMIGWLIDSMIGQTLNHYTVLTQIGEGGMGVVYRAG